MFFVRICIVLSDKFYVFFVRQWY